MKLLIPFFVSTLLPHASMYLTDPFVIPWLLDHTRVATFGVINKGQRPIEVVTWFNETVPTDHTAVPSPGPGFPFAKLKSTSYEQDLAQSMQDVLGKGRATAVPTLYLKMKEGQELPAERIHKTQMCFLGEDEDCMYIRRTARSKACAPFVRIMKYIRVIKIDYTGVVNECSAEDIADDVAFLSSEYEIEGAEAGEQEVMPAPTEEYETEEREAQRRLLNSVEKMFDEHFGMDVDSEAQQAEAQEQEARYNTPNDEWFHLQWHLQRYGIRTFNSRDFGVTHHMGTLPIVTIINHGVWYKHPDFEANMWINQDELKGTTGVDDDGNGYIDDIYGWTAGKPTGVPPMPNGREGTQTAGVIAANSMNKIGVSSVAQNYIRLAICSYGTEDSSENVAECIDWALSIGSRITLHMHSRWHETEQTPNLPLKAAYDALLEKEVLAVHTAGINGKSVGPVRQEGYVYPACFNYPNFITVAGMTKNEGRLSTANYGENCITMAAPGDDITTIADPGYNRDGSFNPAGRMADFNDPEQRTAFYRSTHNSAHAAAYVAGVAGMMNRIVPTMRAFDMKHILRFATIPIKSMARPNTLWGGTPDLEMAAMLASGWCVESFDAALDWQRGDFLHKRIRISPGSGFAYPYGIVTKEKFGYPQPTNGTLVIYSVDEKMNILDRARAWFGYRNSTLYNFIREDTPLC